MQIRWVLLLRSINSESPTKNGPLLHNAVKNEHHQWNYGVTFELSRDSRILGRTAAVSHSSRIGATSSWNENDRKMIGLHEANVKLRLVPYRVRAAVIRKQIIRITSLRNL